MFDTLRQSPEAQEIFRRFLQRTAVRTTALPDPLGRLHVRSAGTQGARVVISARKADALQSAQTHLVGLGIDASWIVADIGMEDDLERLDCEAMDRLGKVDILVNNAGATWGAPTLDHPLSG